MFKIQNVPLLCSFCFIIFLFATIKNHCSHPGHFHLELPLLIPKPRQDFSNLFLSSFALQVRGYLLLCWLSQI